MSKEKDQDEEILEILSSQVLCQNCSGILQFDDRINSWFHISADDFTRCKIVGGKPFLVKKNGEDK